MPSKSPVSLSSSSQFGSSSSSEEEEEEEEEQPPPQTHDDDTPPFSPEPSMPKSNGAAAAATGSDSLPRRPPGRSFRTAQPITTHKPKDAAAAPNSSPKPSLSEKRKSRAPEQDDAPAPKSSPKPSHSEKRKSRAPEQDDAPANVTSKDKKLFVRVWTDGDELVILEGMIAAKQQGEEPEAAIDAFQKRIHKSLHSDFSKSQLADKIRHLRRKYKNQLLRSNEGAEPDFNKPHDRAVFNLSKKVWGGEEITEMNVIEAGHRKTRNGALYPNLKHAIALLEADRDNGGHFLGGSLVEALDLLGPQTAAALDEKWKKHFSAEMKCFSKRLKLKQELLNSLVKATDNV